MKNKFAHKSVQRTAPGVRQLTAARPGPINESLLIQREIYFHPLSTTTTARSAIRLRGVRTYVRLVDERVTETRIKYAVTARDQSAHEPLFSLDPTEGLSDCVPHV